MKLWLGRAAVFAGLLALAAVLRHFLAPLGLAWIVYVGLGLIFAVFGGELVRRAFRRGRERHDWARWRAALLEPEARADAEAELSTALERARLVGARTRLLQARLSIALGAIQLADDRSEDATETLAQLRVSGLEAGPAALVRLARAQAYLHRDDAEGARATLAALTGDLDPVLDATRSATQAALALVEGDLTRAESLAADVAERSDPTDDLHADATVVLAAVRGDAGLLDPLPAESRARALALAAGTARARLEDAP